MDVSRSSRPGIGRRQALAGAGIAWLASGLVAAAQTDASPPAPADQRPNPATRDAQHLPPDITTHHTLDLPDRKLRFAATAGAIQLTDGKDAPRADIAFIAYQMDGAEPAHRPVTFVFNGGPGFASGWLHVGAVGPWRIAIGGDATAPSASPALLANAETWLGHTDLVFLDPVGTGYSRVLTTNDDARRRFFSVDGDIEYLAEAIRRWLDRFERNVSPKYLLGESYGGFRVPRLVRELTSRQGTGVAGAVLLSPVLDFGGRSRVFDPLSYVTRLPSMAATARAARGPVTREQLSDVEHYARTEFLADVTHGEADAEAIARRSARVAEFTGLDPAIVNRYHGLIDNNVFLHELDRAQGRVGSIYDATITSADPSPLDPFSDYADPVLEGLKAPVSSAMVSIYETRLNWRPDKGYRLEGQAVNRQWDWGHNVWSPVESVTAMRAALALDAHFSIYIAHGLFDLITPYFATELQLDQLPNPGIGSRVHLSVFPGGHMFYTNDASRAAFRDEAARQFGWQ
jgi:carboxypeptidase C (cathepsin A)